MSDKRYIAPKIDEDIANRLMTLRGETILLDVDVARLYGVEVKRVNEAVRRNLDKFPAGYLFELTKAETSILRSQIATLKTGSARGKHSKHGNKAFTEKGLYMLATILKSPFATAATIAIVETFAKVRSLKRELLAMHSEPDANNRARMMKHFGETLADIAMPEEETTETESSLELNFFIGKIKHTVRKVRKALASKTQSSRKGGGEMMYGRVEHVEHVGRAA